MIASSVMKVARKSAKPVRQARADPRIRRIGVGRPRPPGPFDYPARAVRTIVGVTRPVLPPKWPIT
jgi:hypothetical protein